MCFCAGGCFGACAVVYEVFEFGEHVGFANNLHPRVQRGEVIRMYGGRAAGDVEFRVIVFAKGMINCFAGFLVRFSSYGAGIYNDEVGFREV